MDARDNNHGRKISVIGLGYVGLPVALAFGRHAEAGAPVVAFDISTMRIAELRQGIDRTREVNGDELARAHLLITDDPAHLATADFHIVTVPTPIDGARRPDLGPVESASRTVGRHMKVGDIVVYESTVYPGVTEEICVPILERESGLVSGRDFSVGYSPERINPGDKAHRFETITKVVSGLDRKTLDTVSNVYSSVVEAGVHRAPNIKTAEAAKVIENTQRDLNIAFMNELALIFHRLDIDTHDVLAAASTKWNFLNFTPGLVGGHCIGVDPYYLTHRAEQTGYHPEVILSGRRINDGMGAHIAAEAVKLLLKNGGAAGARATVLGLTFKENVPDLRNTRSADIVRELVSFGIQVQVHDPMADPEEARHELGLEAMTAESLEPADVVILAVPHRDFVAGGWSLIQRILKEGGGIVMDVKNCLDRVTKPDGITLWRL